MSVKTIIDDALYKTAAPGLAARMAYGAGAGALAGTGVGAAKNDTGSDLGKDIGAGALIGMSGGAALKSRSLGKAVQSEAEDSAPIVKEQVRAVESRSLGKEVKPKSVPATAEIPATESTINFKRSEGGYRKKEKGWNGRKAGFTSQAEAPVQVARQDFLTTAKQDAEKAKAEAEAFAVAEQKAKVPANLDSAAVVADKAHHFSPIKPISNGRNRSWNGRSI